jgi:hypothetical protein
MTTGTEKKRRPCSAYTVQIFSSTPVQLAARQRRVEKEKETVGRCGRSSVLGAQPAAMRLTYLPDGWREVQQGALPPFLSIPFFRVYRGLKVGTL